MKIALPALVSAAAAASADASSDIGLGTVVIVGLLIVFAALTVIFLVMVLMERIFRPGKKVLRVQAPFDGQLDTVVASGAVKKDAVAAIVTDAHGRRSEVLSPAAGVLLFSLAEGASFKRGDILFKVEKEAEADA